FQPAELLAATDNTSPHSPRSGGLHPPCSGPARPEHRPAAASRRSLRACIASLPLQSSWMSKTYLKSDHFNGRGSPRCAHRAVAREALTQPHHARRQEHHKVYSLAPMSRPVSPSTLDFGAASPSLSCQASWPSLVARGPAR